MQCMYRSGIILALGLLLTGGLADSASAQIGPYGSYYRGGVNPYSGYRSTYNTLSRVAADQKSQAQSRAIQQNTAVQQGIRSTLMSQSQARSAQIRSQQQQKQNWWMENLQRQSAAPASYRAVPVTSTSVANAATLATSSSLTGRAATDIVPWPGLLQDSLFDDQRAAIEKPYRERTPGSGRPTLDEYRMIIETAAAMKKGLVQLASRVSAADYLAAGQFLDALAAEAETKSKAKAAAADE